MLNFGSVVGGAWHSGIYDWSGSGYDMKKTEHTRREYGLSFREYLGIWFDTHDIIKEYSDLLEKAAERLYQDKVIDDRFWEEILLSQKVI